MACERSKLSALSLPLLQGLCRAKGLSLEKGANKADIIERLLSQKRRPKEVEEPPSKVAKIERKVQETQSRQKLVFQSSLPGLETQSFRVLRCTCCSVIFNLEKTQYHGDAQSFWCPSCRFRAMDPFNEVSGEGVLHCALLGLGGYEFEVNLSRLQEWRDAGETIWLRMLQVDSQELFQVWPEELAVEVDGCQLFRVAPPEKGHKRRDVPQDITDWLQAGPNVLRLRFTDAQGLALGLVRAAPKAPRRLCLEVPRQEAPEARAKLLTLLRNSEEDGLEFVASRQLSLLCPVALARVERPARGRRCRHLRCFGLAAYCRSNYGMAAFNNRWSCPVCNKRVRPEELLIDGFVEDILQKTEAPLWGQAWCWTMNILIIWRFIPSQFQKVRRGAL
ncbi:unnamed protein product [Cladocopium goreaui]|uniref:SP-RING-type domain-containing protein n=1 Tax=Cladocopium goreaui TaxID=2562237 RepID=A0A9P1C951_9DINO|nr:unnamed protein product [Cladocopium goreaui]